VIFLSPSCNDSLYCSGYCPGAIWECLHRVIPIVIPAPDQVEAKLHGNDGIMHIIAFSESAIPLVLRAGASDSSNSAGG
jgi:hypothetical protein